MYIYEDKILGYQQVGEAYAPLLAIVPITGKPGERTVHSVINPLQKRSDPMSWMSCTELLDQTGNRIKFYRSVAAVSMDIKIESKKSAGLNYSQE